MAETDSQPETKNQEAKPPKLGRKWFWRGFLLVFVCVLIFSKQGRLIRVPSGPALAFVPLYQFYITEAPKAFASHRTMGMASESNFWTILFQHLGISAIGGGVFVGLHRMLLKPQKDPNQTSIN